MKKRVSTLLAGGMLALSACAPVPTAAPPSPGAVTPPPSAAAPAHEQVRQQIVAHLRSGRHEAALEMIEKERRRRGSEGVLQEEHLQVLRALAVTAEESFEAGEYDQSGRALHLILSHYPKEQGAAARLGISRQDLQERMELCAEHLMSEGLADYRNGNLPAAIDTWKKILIFHDTHDGAKRGIQTAEIQLQNLRSLQ